MARRPQTDAPAAATADDGLVAVTLPADNAIGAVAVGTMLPGRSYRVTCAEARRLTSLKGFAYVSDADRTRALDDARRIVATIDNPED